jgi:hypothetical protein
MKNFLAKHSVRLVGLLAAVTPILLHRFPGVPWEALIGAGAGFLGIGEVTQRKQDAKTASAWAIAEAAQYALGQLEKVQTGTEVDTTVPAEPVNVQPAPAVPATVPAAGVIGQAKL